MTMFYWKPTDGDADGLANRFKKAGQLQVAVVNDTVGMTPFETPGQLSAWIEVIEAHFQCSYVGEGPDVVA